MLGVIAVFGRKIGAHKILDSGAALRRRADALSLSAQLVSDRSGDQLILGFEVRVKGACGQACVRHQPDYPGTVDPVTLEPATSGLDDSLPGRPFVLLAV